MSISYRVRFFALFLMLILFISGVANAQVVFLGRKAIGMISQLTSEMTGSGNPGYDVATVIIDASAEKVYSTAVNLLQAKEGWNVTRKEDESRLIEFSDGKHNAKMQVTSLDENLSQLLVASTVTSSNAGTTSLVLNGVLHVCSEMGVHCELAGE